jgi:hypothetical protein
VDIFQWWESIVDPIAKPTADLGAEALRKYQAGEIDRETYEAATRKDAQLKGGIADALKDYSIFAAENPLDVSGVLKPATDLMKNLVAVLLVAGAIYVAINWKRLAA